MRKALSPSLTLPFLRPSGCLLKRVFALDMVRRPWCQRGSLRIITAITHGEVIRKILRHLKFAVDPPPIALARRRQDAFARSSA